jgi:hypothetical protein
MPDVYQKYQLEFCLRGLLNLRQTHPNRCQPGSLHVHLMKEYHHYAKHLLRQHVWVLEALQGASKWPNSLCKVYGDHSRTQNNCLQYYVEELWLPKRARTLFYQMSAVSGTSAHQVLTMLPYPVHLTYGRFIYDNCQNECNFMAQTWL